MSAEALHMTEVARIAQPAKESPQVRTLPPSDGWSLERFAREQIRGLVRQVFTASGTRPVRQVVFSAIEPETDVRSLCRRVGETLAAEMQGDIAVVGDYPRLLPEGTEATNGVGKNRETPLRQIATRVRGNLWLVPSEENAGSRAGTASLHTRLGEIRRQFEYSIVEGPAAGESNETTAMAQFADGIILVLSAQNTRRVTARKVKETMEWAQVRILGTVLSDREFPIPERIYRRL